MRCERCNKTITEQTVRIYQGRCVPCHRKRLSQKLPRLLRGALSITGSILTMPFCLPRDLVRELHFRLTPVPFTRREVIATMAPIHGHEAARTYFAGLRIGFLRGAGYSGRFFFTLGMHDGAVLRRDLSQWPAILQSRATKPITIA